MSKKYIPHFQNNQKNTFKASFYEKNLNALEKRFPDIALKIKNTAVKNYKLIKNLNEKKFNLYINEIKNYYYNEENINKDVKKNIDSLNLKNAKLAIFLGFGLGYQTKYFVDNMADKQKTDHILIIEKDPEIFKLALETQDFSVFISNPNTYFIIGEKEENIFPILTNYFKEDTKIIYLKSIQTIYYPSDFIISKDYYMNIIRKISESGTFVLRFYGNDPKDSLIGIENMLENLSEIIKNPGINLLINKFKNKPAIIASTGPSLNKNKHLLKGLEDKALIIAPDASLKPLMDIGVKPNIITALERVPLSVELVKGFKSEDVKDVYYAACPVVMKEAYENYPGPRIIVYRNFDHFKWLGIERGILDIKQSSGNMAFKIADALGCNPIILIGQDLAYSNDGKTHASGSTLGEVQGNKNLKTFEVLGNDGKPILTTDTWNEFRLGYELDIKNYKGKCINATEGGAYINGTEVMTFKEAIDKYIKDSFNPSEEIRKYLSVFTLKNEKNDFETVKKITDETLKDLIEIQNLCLEGFNFLTEKNELISSFFSENTNFKKDYNEINSIETKAIKTRNKIIIEKHKTVQLFLMHIIQSFSIKFHMDLLSVPSKYDDISIIKAENCLLYRKWFAIVHDIVKICIDLLEKTKSDFNNINIK